MVNDFERKNIIDSLGLPPEQVTRIHNGYNEWFKPTSDTECIYRKYIDEPGYFFFLGNTDPKKNPNRKLIAYSRYLEMSDVMRKLQEIYLLKWIFHLRNIYLFLNLNISFQISQRRILIFLQKLF